jgi:SAM-dependent MidA family methyltransferase
LKTWTGNAELIDSIRTEIRKNGPLPFSRFMQQALYHPQHGYYSSGRAAIGRNGDYFTSVSVGPLFGQLLTTQFVEIWERLGRSEDFVIVEQGAHDAQFARDVFEFAQEHAPDFLAALRYRIVEPFPAWQDRQRQMVETYRGKVEWRESLEPFVGIHFSNELFDAMPVDLPGKWVDLDGDNFIFVNESTPETRRFNQAALDCIGKVAATLQRGYAIAIDYGHLRDDFEPVVQVRARHRHLDSPFEQIGQADITAHVDWKSIITRSKGDGLEVAGFTDQHHFLTGIISELTKDGLLDWPRRVSASHVDSKSKRELQTLLHPEMMGRSFQVLALSKNVDTREPLAGFKFARAADLD